MSMRFLADLARSPLPQTTYRQEEIDAIKVLRAAGLVIALVSEPANGAGGLATAQVLAITEKGQAELDAADAPLRRPPPRGPASWLRRIARHQDGERRP